MAVASGGREPCFPASVVSSALLEAAGPHELLLRWQGNDDWARWEAELAVAAPFGSQPLYLLPPVSMSALCGSCSGQAIWDRRHT